MLTNIDAVIFDMDGTLVDSMWIWDEIDRVFFAQRKLPYEKKMQHEVEGMHIEEIAAHFKQKFDLQDSIKELVTLWSEMAYEVYKTEVDYKLGVRRFLNYCRNNKIIMGIATSNSIEMINAIEDRLDFSEFFDCIVTAYEVQKGKPAPDVYLEAARQLNVSPDRCLVFEDIPMGMLAGKKAGMSVCGVQDASSADQEELKRSYCDYYINSFHDFFTKEYEEN